MAFFDHKTTQINLEGIFDTVQTTETALEQKTATLEAVDTALPIATTQETKKDQNFEAGSAYP